MLDTAARAELLSSLRHIAQERLAHALHALFDELDSRLFDLAERSRVMAQQQSYFNGLRECRRQRVALETDFLHAIDDAFRIVPATADKPAGRVPLSLMPREELEETLALSAQTERRTRALTGPLQVLEKRLAELLQRAPISPETNALSPESLALAFRHAMQLLDVEVEVRLIAHSLFGLHVLGALEPLYSTLNHRLAEAGVLPELRYDDAPHVVRSTQIPPPKHAPPRRLPETFGERKTEVSPEAPASGYEPRVDGHEVRLTELKHLLQRLSTAGQRSAVAPPVFGNAEAVGDTLDHGVLQHSLDQLWTYEGQPRDLKSTLVETARKDSPDAPGALQPEDEDTIDMIALVFESVRNDPNLPEPLRALLARLQIPFLKTAFTDPNLLEGDHHPARQLLDELGALAMSWCASADPDRALLRQIALIVESLASHHTDGPVRFDQAIEKLSSFLDNGRRRAEIAEQRSIEAALGKERLRVARLRVASLLDMHLRNTDPLPWMRQVLRGPWANYLVLLWLRQGEASQEYRDARRFIDELLWCDSPKVRQEEPERLRAARNELPNIFRQGMARIASHDREVELLAEQLDAFLSTVVAGVPVPDFVYENDPTLDLADLSRQLADAPLENQPLPQDVDAGMLAHLRALPPGSWFEFKREGEPERARLSWVSPYSNRSLLVNRSGMKVMEMDVEHLARQIDQGMARVIDGTRLLERTLSGLVEQLRQISDEAPPQSDQDVA